MIFALGRPSEFNRRLRAVAPFSALDARRERSVFVRGLPVDVTLRISGLWRPANLPFFTGVAKASGQALACST